MTYYVYMLLSKESSITYVGYTNNLKKRLNLHNSGKGAKFTRGRRWKVIYKKKYTSKNDALKNEYTLKNNYLLRKKIKINYFNYLK